VKLKEKKKNWSGNTKKEKIKEKAGRKRILYLRINANTSKNEKKKVKLIGF
jgi:hypothetical protein